MALSSAQLKRLRGKSWREVRTRTQQEWARLTERLVGAGCAELGDLALRQELSSIARNGAVEDAVARITARLRTFQGKTFFPSLAYREEIKAVMKCRFPSQSQAIVARAEQVCEERFDLLGFRNLNFGRPIDWRLEPISGHRTPLVHWSQVDFLNPEVAGDKKVTWELNRHQFFVTLGQAYWLTGDEFFAKAFVSFASSWMDANPPKQGINWASSLELALRAISWLWALHLFADSEELTTRFVLRLLKYFVAHGRHIETYLSHYFSPNTHLTGEALGLFHLGTALPELGRAEVWRKLGLSILLTQLPRQVQRDGVYFEQSSYYHRYTADFYTHLLVLARTSGIALPNEVEEKLKLLLEHLMWITRPDGSSPFFGDDDGGRLVVLGDREADDFRDTLATGAVLFGRGDWKFVAGEATVETLWLLGPRAISNYDGVVPQPARTHTRGFDASGYFVMRDGWSRQSSYVLIDCGVRGAENCGHAHADALSFEFASGGMNWFVDPGTYTYTGDARARDEFRSASAHNAVMVDGKEASVPAGPFSWSWIAQATTLEISDTETGIYFSGRQNGYERLSDPIGHQRSWHLREAEPQRGLPVHLIVRDVFTAHERHHYQLRFHFSAGCRAFADGNRVEATAPGGELLLVACAHGDPCSSPSGVRARVGSGWVSRCYGQREPAPVAVMEVWGQGPQTIATIIVPIVLPGREDAERFIQSWLAEEQARLRVSRPGPENTDYRARLQRVPILMVV